MRMFLSLAIKSGSKVYNILWLYFGEIIGISKKYRAQGTLFKVGAERLGKLQGCMFNGVIFINRHGWIQVSCHVTP